MQTDYDITRHASESLIEYVPKSERYPFETKTESSYMHSALWFVPSEHNPFIMASNPLMSLICRIQTLEKKSQALQQRLHDEWQAFCDTLSEQAEPEATRITARFILGLWLRDALSHQHNLTHMLPLKLQSQAYQNPEPFFQLANDLMKTPEKNSLFIDWMALLLKQGFASQHAENLVLNNARHNLLQHIQNRKTQAHIETPRDEIVLLLAHLKQRQNQYRYMTWVALGSIGFIFLLYTGMHIWLVQQLAQTLHHLQNLLENYHV